MDMRKNQDIDTSLPLRVAIRTRETEPRAGERTERTERNTTDTFPRFKIGRRPSTSACNSARTRINQPKPPFPPSLLPCFALEPIRCVLSPEEDDGALGLEGREALVVVNLNEVRLLAEDRPGNGTSLRARHQQHEVEGRWIPSFPQSHAPMTY